MVVWRLRRCSIVETNAAHASPLRLGASTRRAARPACQRRSEARHLQGFRCSGCTGRRRHGRRRFRIHARERWSPECCRASRTVETPRGPVRGSRPHRAQPVQHGRGATPAHLKVLWYPNLALLCVSSADLLLRAARWSACVAAWWRFPLLGRRTRSVLRFCCAVARAFRVRCFLPCATTPVALGPPSTGSPIEIALSHPSKSPVLGTDRLLVPPGWRAWAGAGADDGTEGKSPPSHDVATLRGTGCGKGGGVAHTLRPTARRRHALPACPSCITALHERVVRATNCGASWCRAEAAAWARRIGPSSVLIHDARIHARSTLAQVLGRGGLLGSDRLQVHMDPTGSAVLSTRLVL